MKIFAMSDIHGCLDAFLNALSLVDLEDKNNNKVIACLIPYLKIPLNIGDFIFAVSAYFSIFIILNVNRVAVGVATGLHFRVALWGCSWGCNRVAL